MVDRIYAIDLLRAREGGREVLREMRAAVGRAKRNAAGDWRLTGTALTRQGEKLLFCFRLVKR